MAQQWGRKERIIWQPHLPIYTCMGLAGAVLCTLFFLWENYSFQQPAIRRAYTMEYLRAFVGAQFKQHGKYELIQLGGAGRKERLATASDFMEGTTLLPEGARGELVHWYHRQGGTNPVLDDFIRKHDGSRYKVKGINRDLG